MSTHVRQGRRQSGKGRAVWAETLPRRTLGQEGDCVQQHLGLAVTSPDILGKGRSREGCWAHVEHPSQCSCFGPFLCPRVGQPTFSRTLGMLVYSGLGAP